ncbi:Oxysterol-binding protein [Laetiporus sulphureus 93-53]|uniref:Oxysterol-binding protein n=1 Tax=Laetiporus sulphureus 93-53 TaxID=1314785 RepID=A0A165FGK3_9APHY|nr:Oxysterol-binding protein [Laetiporus sulphureus 93-53]KZT08937.1 Oxysterol-binding protein [Laetiporus sulphureus 93-53]
MMGLFNQATSKVHRPRGPSVEDKMPDDTDPDDVSILDEEEGSIIKSLISQLRVGMDLSKVTFPTFVLEPRSMLERITDFMSHPDLIFGYVPDSLERKCCTPDELPSAEDCDDPEERFIRVLRYYLAGWHIKPKGVKKPYNPVLGEFFRCRYDYPDGSQGFYISEQVSHHPPVSAFYYVSPANRVCIVSELRPKSKFLGNSVSTQMEGENRVYLMGRPEDGPYVISMPNMYARGILWGKMILELGDTCTARNDHNGICAELTFKTKGYFSGTYNAIQGRIRNGAADTGEVVGKWSAVMEYKDNKTGERRVLFDVKKDGDKIAPKWVAPEDEQEPNESRRLWAKLTQAIVAKDMLAATEAKTAVEESQRELRRRREESGEKFIPRFFRQDKEGRWVPKITLPEDPQEAVEVVRNWIWAPPPDSRH